MPVRTKKKIIEIRPLGAQNEQKQNWSSLCCVLLCCVVFVLWCVMCCGVVAACSSPSFCFRLCLLVLVALFVFVLTELSEKLSLWNNDDWKNASHLLSVNSIGRVTQVRKTIWDDPWPQLLMFGQV